MNSAFFQELRFLISVNLSKKKKSRAIQVVFFSLREFYVFQQVNQIKSLERELETIHLENEGLKKKQVKLDEQLMEVSF